MCLINVFVSHAQGPHGVRGYLGESGVDGKNVSYIVVENCMKVLMFIVNI